MQKVLSVKRAVAAAAVLALVAVFALVAASVGSSSASAATLKRAAPGSALAREQILLRSAQQLGWRLTPTGRAVVEKGILPTEAGTTLALAPAGADIGALKEAAATAIARSLQSARRAHGSTYVFMNCGIGQKANVNYYVAPYATTWVAWNFVNFQTGASKNVNSSTSYCPGNGGCLEYFWIIPGAPWYVFAAEEWSNNGVPSPFSQYCGG